MTDEDRAGMRAFSLFWMITLLGVWIVLRVSNPDMTSMRMVLAYWYIYVLYLSAVGAYMWGRIG